MTEEANLKLQLEDFGLNKDEIIIYVGLLRMGPSKVRQICNFTNLNRVKGYRILEKLKEHGFVSSTFSNPTLFSAIDLKKSLQNVISRKKFEVERLDKLKTLLCENCETLNFNVKKIDAPQFAIISGRYNIYSYISTMIKEATSDLYLIATFDDVAKMYYTSIPESIQKIQKKGITLRFITEPDERLDVKIIQRMKLKNFRTANLPSKGRIVCGGSESLVSGNTTETQNMNSDADTALLTDSADFVNNMKCLCKQIWKSGKPIELLKEKGVML